MKLQINKKVTNVKSAIFAVTDSLNYYISPASLKDINVPKLADQIVADTRKQFGEQFTKLNLESILNETIKGMTTTAKTAKPSIGARKEIQLTDDDNKIINDPTMSINKKVAALEHLWSHQSVLSKALGKGRQRIINAIKLAKKIK